MDLNPQLLALGHEHDLVEQRTDQLEGLILHAVAGQRLGQRGDFLPVDLGQVGMEERLLRLGRGGDLGLQLLLPGLEGEQLLLQGARGHAVRDRLHDPSEPSLDLGQLRPQPVPPGILMAPHPIDFGHVLRAERLEQLGVHEVVSQRIEHRLLEPVGPDVPEVGAHGGALVAGGSAAEQVGADLGVAAAARTADDQSREQVAGAATIARASTDIGAGIAAHRLLARLDPVPQLLRHDPQLRDVLHHPLRGIVVARHPPARVRVFDEALPVPDVFADVELVVEDAVTAGGVAADRGRAPGPAARARNALGVQVVRNSARRAPGGVCLEDPAHDLGFAWIDPSQAAYRHTIRADLANNIVAIRDAAARSACFDPAPETAPRLVGEVLQVEGIHGPLEPDMEVGDLAVSQGHDPHAVEPHALEDVRDVLQVAGQAVQGFGEDDVDLTGGSVVQQLLNAWPDQAGARDGLIGVVPGDQQSLLGGPLGADAQLVIDRGRALQVGGDAGIQSRPRCTVGLGRGHTELQLA